MPITEITTRSSPTLRGVQEWRAGDESQPIPVVILELQDKLSRSRLREALWLSVMFHLFVIIAVSTAPQWVPNYRVKPFIATDVFKNQDQTFLALPPDLEKVTEKPKTNVLSDKDRIAQSRHPELNHKELRKIIDSTPPGPPQPPAQQMASAAPPAQAPMPPGQQPNAGAQQQGAGGPPAVAQNQSPKLETLQPGSRSRTGSNPFAAALAQGSSVEELARGTAHNRGIGGGAGGDYGVAPRTNANVQGGLEVLSDTQGVDFGPYLERVVFKVKQNWYNVIPDSVRGPLYKRGKVSIDFAILKDGTVAGMRIIGPSGDVALDRAAWSGINASNPFPPLPTQFTGPYLALRFHFFYNPGKEDLQ